jgi:hypothetical protein
MLLHPITLCLYVSVSWSSARVGLEARWGVGRFEHRSTGIVDHTPKASSNSLSIRGLPLGFGHPCWTGGHRAPNHRRPRTSDPMTGANGVHRNRRVDWDGQTGRHIDASSDSRRRRASPKSPCPWGLPTKPTGGLEPPTPSLRAFPVTLPGTAGQCPSEFWRLWATSRAWRDISRDAKRTPHPAARSPVGSPGALGVGATRELASTRERCWFEPSHALLRS